MGEVIEEQRNYILGWNAYHGLAQIPGKLRDLDSWVCHRMRAMQLKHWRRGRTMYRELRKLGDSHEQAACIAVITPAIIAPATKGRKAISGPVCHPERSEGSIFIPDNALWILRLAQNDIQ